MTKIYIKASKHFGALDISDMARAVGINIKIYHRYVKIGLLPAPQHGNDKRRYYHTEDIDKIKSLLQEASS